jgi:hypothetical protein
MNMKSKQVQQPEKGIRISRLVLASEPPSSALTLSYPVKQSSYVLLMSFSALVSFTRSLAAADFSLPFCLPRLHRSQKQQQQTRTNAQNVFGRFFCVPCCGRSPNSMLLCIFLHLSSNLLDSIQVIEALFRLQTRNLIMLL